MQHFHVNASLPHSGSELLQALLAQHPDVYASPTSPVLEFVFGALGNFGLPEVRSQDAADMQRAFEGFARAGIRGWYESRTDKPVVIDKSRGWIEYAELLWAYYPDARIVCMHRHPDAIVTALEAIYRANIGHPETLHLPKTAARRRQFWLASGQLPLGLARLLFIVLNHPADTP
jgi:sulfotransferase